MRLTRDFDETVKERLAESAAFRRALLSEVMSCAFQDDIDSAKSLLRKYVNGTVGFVALGKALGKDSKTLMRMLSPSGNPTVRNFMAIVGYLQKHEGLVFEVVEKRAA